MAAHGRVAATRRPRRLRRAEACRGILDATVACSVEHGYGETTTLAVQARAVVSRGALLHRAAPVRSPTKP